MPLESVLQDTGSQLAASAVEHIAQNAEHYCDEECDRMALGNEPRIHELNAEGQHLQEHAAHLKERLHAIPHPASPEERKRRIRYYTAVGIMLAFAGLAFTIIAFDPFRLGVIGVLYALGIAIATPFAVAEFLEAWKAEYIKRTVIAVVFAAAIVGGMLLASVRGEVMARKVATTTPPVTIESDMAPAPASYPAPAPSFYETTAASLQLLLLLFAIAIDLSSGIALHRARAERAAIDGEYEAVAQELATVRQRLGAIVYEITALSNAPAAFKATFWRDFYGTVLAQTIRKAATKGLTLALVLAAFFPYHAFAAERTNIVIALDLSVSEGMIGENGTTAFAKNVAAIGKVLATVPPNSHITVIRIGRDSIMNPTPLLSAEVPSDEGYFGEQLAAARDALVRTWRARAARLMPTEQGTDILGALQLAAEILRVSTPHGRRILMVFSDMRNATKALNLEIADPDTSTAFMAAAQERNLTVDLRGVTVYVGGANGGGTEIRTWKGIKDFWMAYFEKAGAQCASYSMLSAPPDITH
jgi:hypothetical protein